LVVLSFRKLEELPAPARSNQGQGANMTRLGVVSSMLAIALSFHAPGAWANTIAKSVIEFTASAFAPTMQGATADYVRIELGNIVANKTFDATTLDVAASSATITRGTGKVAAVIPVPFALDVRTMQPRFSSSVVNPPGGKITPRPGFVDFGRTVPNTDPNTMKTQPLVPTATFQPGDRLNVKLVFKGNVSFIARNGLFKDGDGGTGVNTPIAGGQFKIPGGTAKFDPQYAVTNDLDLTLFPGDAPFIVQNLTFLSNLTGAQFDALDLDAILAGTLAPGTTPAPNFELISSDSSSGLFPSAQSFIDPFAEPAPGLFDVALGQVFDPDTGTLSAFIDGYQGAVPLPPTVWLFAAGLGLLTLVRWQGRRRGCSGRIR
jgi:hypothetical protein